MNREEKSREIELLAKDLQSGPATIVLAPHGLTVNQIAGLRKKVKANASHYRVVKNRLAVRALKETPLQELSEHFRGPTAIAYCDADPAPLAKIIGEFSKANKGLQIKAAFLDGRVVGPSEIRTLAELPPRPMLVARFLGALNAPMRGLVGVLKAPIRDLVRVIEAIGRNKEGGSAPQS